MGAEPGKVIKIFDKLKDGRGEKMREPGEESGRKGGYGKRINEAAGNAPDKILQSHAMSLSDDRMNALRSKITTLKRRGRGQHIKNNAVLKFKHIIKKKN